MRSWERCFYFPVIFCVFLGLYGAPALAQGVNFSVKIGAQGVQGTGVESQRLTEAPENDVFIGGGCINFLRLLQSLLGLRGGDDIDALSYPEPLIIVSLMPGEGWADMSGSPLFWHFSVDPMAIGALGTAVNQEVGMGTSSCGEMLMPPEAHGDCFWTSLMNPNSNVLGNDETRFGLLLANPVNDDLNALDLQAAPIVRPGGCLQPGDLYFSLALGSPSLTGGITAGDILEPNGIGGFQVALSSVLLGTTGADLDALFMDATGTPFFSVTGMLPNGAMPGDILTRDGVYGLLDGWADVVITAMQLGLTPIDNLDALDAALQPLEGVMPPEPVKDVACGDQDGDGIPDTSDNCPTTPNTDQANHDSDSHGDACDNCPTTANENQANSDNDSHGDACDNCPNTDNENQADGDSDTVGDVCDNCPLIANTNQSDLDADTKGDLCDNCPTVPNPGQEDADQDNIGDVCDEECPPGSLFSQPPCPLQDPRFSVWVSDLTVGQGNPLMPAPYDNYAVASDICDVHWWGTEVSLATFGPGLRLLDEFEITFYQDNAGQPGAVACQYSVIAIKQPTGIIAPYDAGFGAGTQLYALYKYDAVLSPCCVLRSGWISIKGTTNGSQNGVVFLMLTSCTGDNLDLTYNGAVFESHQEDLAFCLTGGDGEGEGEGIVEGEGAAEGEGEGIVEGEGVVEGEGMAEGEGLPEGQEEGSVEGEPPCESCVHTGPGTYRVNADVCLCVPSPSATSTFWWTKDGFDLSGRVDRVDCRCLLLRSVQVADSGIYRCAYDDETKASSVYEASITVEETVPAAEVSALVFLITALGSAGVLVYRRRK